MTSINLSSTDAASQRTDAIVIGIAAGSSPTDLVLAPGAESVDKALKKRLVAELRALGARGKAGEVTKLSTLGATRAGVLVAVGLGDARNDGYPAETLRRAAGAGIRALAGTAKAALALPVNSPEQVAAVAEGVLLGAYVYSRYRSASKDQQRAPVEAVTIVTAKPRDRAAKAAVERAETVCKAVCLARDLVNTPPADLHPQDFADIARSTAKASSGTLKVEVLDDEALRKGGYGGLIGVGQGSVNPPRLVRLAYRSKKPKSHLAILGKGITFDSGGLSLKPPQAMEWMKADMGGAAAVLGAMLAIAELGPEVDVTGYAAMAENMPSGTAQRPSDVITIYGGRTVEVLNTDAEGRLVLADAIVRASEDSPSLIVDAATLTGAQLVALGGRTSAIMANDDDLRSALHDTSGRAGESMWPMPLPDELRKSLDSKIADISNIGDRYGGMLSAGVFLREFVPEGTKWAHLDIAGPAWNADEPYGYVPSGGTGAAVRTFVQLAEDLANGTVSV